MKSTKKLALLIYVCHLSAVLVAATPAEVVKLLRQRETRSSAMKQVGDHGESIVTMLIKLSADASVSEDDRATALLALGKTSSPSARTHLVSACRNRTSAFEREAALIGLFNLGGQTGIPEFQMARKDSDPQVRARAVWCLAKLGDTSVKAEALTMIASEHIGAQAIAVETLEIIGGKETIEVLRANYTHANPFVRINSRLAVTRIEFKSLGASSRLQYLTSVIGDQEYEIQTWAAQELGRIAFPPEGPVNGTALEILRNVAGREDHPGQRAAAKRLSILGSQGKYDPRDSAK